MLKQQRNEYTPSKRSWQLTNCKSMPLHTAVKHSKTNIRLRVQMWMLCRMGSLIHCCWGPHRQLTKRMEGAHFVFLQTSEARQPCMRRAERVQDVTSKLAIDVQYKNFHMTWHSTYEIWLVTFILHLKYPPLSCYNWWFYWTDLLDQAIEQNVSTANEGTK